MERTIQKIRKFVAQTLEWSAESTKNLGLSIGAAMLVMFLGYVLCFSIPKRVISSARTNAEAALASASEQYATANSRLSAEQGWYTLPYTSDLPSTLSQSSILLSQANSSLADIGKRFNVDSKLKAAREAKSSAENSAVFAQQVINTLDNNLMLREQAYAQRETTGTSIENAEMAIASNRQRFENDKGQYHPKYMLPLAANLEKSSMQNVPAAQEYWNAGVGYLPDLSDQTRSGDPTKALQEFDQAKVHVDEINALMAQVTTQLDYQAEAKTNAVSRTQEAASTLASSSLYVGGLKTKTGYWLAQATGSLSVSEQQLDLANLTLAQLLDGYVDHPVAYEAAKESITLSQQAITEADAEVALAQKALASIQQLESDLGTTRKNVASANGYYTVLEANHATSTWSSVASNIGNANSFIASAENMQQDAINNASLTVQRFADSFSESQSAIDDLRQARSLAQEVVDKTNSLEGYRVEWPNARSQAQSTIDAERPSVTQYGSYAYSAKSDFENAVSLLEQAIGEALGLRYEPAVDKANQAKSLASGTGNRAQRGYQDYLDEQERIRQAQEDAQRRAEEESSSQSYSSPSDFGSNDYGGGGGSSDYGGGGSSDYGGGGDSDFGGGSDSDW